MKSRNWKLCTMCPVCGGFDTDVNIGCICPRCGKGYLDLKMYRYVNMVIWYKPWTWFRKSNIEITEYFYGWDMEGEE